MEQQTQHQQGGLNDLVNKHPLIAAVLGMGISLTGAYNMVNTHETTIKTHQSKIESLERESIMQNARIEVLSKDQTKFDKTLDAINTTLSEVNQTLAGLKVTVESLKEKK